MKKAAKKDVKKKELPFLFGEVKATIQVTAEDIKNGEPNDPRGCPIALALIREFGDDPSVDSSIATFTRHGIEFSGYLPDKAGNFVNDFDSSKQVKPFKFDVTFEPSDEESFELDIAVTAQDIKAAKRFSPSEDPIALAVKRVTSQTVLVSGTQVVVVLDRKTYIADLPTAAVEAVNAFDKKKAVKPFSFRVTFDYSY